MTTLRNRFVLLAIFALGVAMPASAATITIVNVNAPGVGFNDPTPVAPVGGNPGTTRGEQAINAFQFAADIWGATLQSDAEIFIQASFSPLNCTATAATLGAAGALQVFSNFPGAEYSDTWYHVALANKLAGGDLAPGPGGTNADDIVAFFNSRLGQPNCLPNQGWYFGFDTNHGTNLDLVTVLLHEFGHGLGFSNFVNEQTGSNTGPPFFTDIYSQYTIDDTTGVAWSAMSNAQRQVSALNSRNVSWTGLNVTASVPTTLAFGTPLVRINAPASLAGVLAVGAAVFGPPLNSTGVSGSVVIALDAVDAAGPTTTDGCSPIDNAAAVAGNIALVDRGGCGFVVKVKNAQNAGAVAVLVADNAPGAPPATMGGADPTIVIPSVRITLPAGNALKAATGVNATLIVDPTVRAGANTVGRALLNAPNPVQLGSSISHWDPIASPNLLMEPAISADLTHGLDLTTPQMVDIGWFSDGDGVPDGRDQCIGSDERSTVVIGNCDSGVPNKVFANGCRISDGIEDCFDRPDNSGQGSVSSCISHYTNDLKKRGIITGAQRGAIQSCSNGNSRN